VAHCLAQWDPPASDATVMTVCLHMMNVETERRDSSSMLITDLCRSNSPSAAPMFALFASKISLASSVGLEWFKPLWTSPNNLTLQKAGADLFDRLTRELQEALPEVVVRSEFSFARLRASRLLTLPYFRRFLRACLWKRDVIGEVIVAGPIDSGVKAKKPVSIRYNYIGGGMSGMILPEEAVGLPEGTKMPLSLDMSVASSLSWLKGAPPFKLAHWKGDHDRAIQAIHTWLVDPKTDWDAIVTELTKDNPWFDRTE
jgi:hypothetical protein